MQRSTPGAEVECVVTSKTDAEESNPELRAGEPTSYSGASWSQISLGRAFSPPPPPTCVKIDLNNLTIWLRKWESATPTFRLSHCSELTFTEEIPLPGNSDCHWVPLMLGEARHPTTTQERVRFTYPRAQLCAISTGSMYDSSFFPSWEKLWQHFSPRRTLGK